MADKQIIYDCPHVSFTDWGTYACRLYEPRDKNCLVEHGTCASNVSCPYKQSRTKEKECDQLKQAVEKVRELIQKEINDCEHRDDCTSCEYNCCIRQAMQICNEVISE